MASYLTCSATVNNLNFKYLFELILFTYHLIRFFQLRIKQVCCSGVIYTKKPHQHCCEDSYLSLNNSSNPVCCNGKLVPSLPDHQCCGGYYVHVKTSEFQITLCSVFPLTSNLLCSAFMGFALLRVAQVFTSFVLVFVDEYCCPDHSQGRVSVGLGDSCCGGVPYSVTGGQLCCSGTLHDGYGVQCCGGQIVDKTLVCCGDAERGAVHKYAPGE